MLNRNAQCSHWWFTVDAEDHLLPSPSSQMFDHRLDNVSSWSLCFHTTCCHHAGSNVQHVQEGEQLLAWCDLHKTVVGHDDRELWLFVWIVSSSCSHAVAAPVTETLVRNLVRSFLCRIWTNWDALSSNFPFLLSAVRCAIDVSTWCATGSLGTMCIRTF